MNKYFIYIIFLASGILLGVFFCNFSYFTFDKTIKITDLVSWVVTSIVGLYIAINVNKGFQKNHSEKEIIIIEIKELLKALNKIIFFINAKKLPFQSTISQFKKINENLNLVETLISQSHCSGLDISHLKKDLHNLRRLITKISPINDFINLDDDGFKKVFKNTIDLKNAFYRAIFLINKC